MEKPKSNKALLLSYMGLAFQLMASLGLATYVGWWLDKWIKSGMYLFIWLLPLIVVIGIIIKAVKDTSKK